MLIRSIISGGVDLTTLIIYIISSLAVIFLTMPIHEFAHAFVAVKLGDPTPRYQGRLSINPFRHIDYLGAACIIFFGFGWARPVMVQSENFKKPKWGMALTAFAGPMANILLATISLLLCNIFVVSTINVDAYWPVYVILFFEYIAQINIYLAVFNLIPIPPLDGSKLLSALLPNRIYYKFMRYEQYFSIILFALLWGGILDIPLQFLGGAVSSAISYITTLPFIIFG